MNRPSLSVFLEAPTGLDEDRPIERVEAVELRLQRVLGAVIDRIGREEAVEAAGIDREQAVEVVAVVNGDRSTPVANLTVADAAALIAAEMAFPRDEVRGRIRDHLLITMSREPTDIDELSETYGFGDSRRLRARINGEEPLSLRDYARLRVALAPSEQNHNP